MKGDFSRQTFDAKKHYTRVLTQQGRVQLDADWNEQQSIHQHRTATESKDVVGASGAPQHDAGFLISTADGKTLTIGRGRYYVHGVLCENESDTAYQSQPDFPNAPDVIALLTTAQATAAIVYLDVWSRTITALDDPLIREAALGGPDTATRLKTVWQVKALPAKPAGGGAVSCGDPLAEWDTLTAPSTGMLSARAQPTQATDTPCLLPPSAGYRRLENQLYRVEVHQGGPLGAATFKWSRDNGAVVTTVESVNGQDVTVHDLGRDDVLGFAGAQWVELTDDAQELAGRPGQLLQIDHVNMATRVVSLKTAPTAVSPTGHPKLRRWDSVGSLTVVVPTTNGGWISLEDGVEVKFEAGDYKTGDYWLIPARTAIGDIEWPFASPQPPLGIVHHYSRLAVATLGGGALTVQDCRSIFSALADAPPAVHVTGINWVNDDVVSQDFIQTSGLQVFFDNALRPPPTDGSSDVVVVNLEMPLVVKPAAAATDAPVTVQVAAILNGDLSFPAANLLLWRPAKGGAEIKSLIAFLVGQQVARVRVRYSLKGRSLWQDNKAGTRLYVDGQALGLSGLRADGTPRIDLQLPSGDRRRASDFDSWFYVQLQIPPANLAGLSLSDSAVLAGTPVTGTVTLDFPAPANGVQVKLTSSAAQATVPPTVTVQGGATQAIFTVTTLVTQLASSNIVVITATAGNAVSTAQFTLQVISVSVSPTEMSLSGSHSQQFAAVVTGTDDQTVNWGVAEPGGGSVTASGLYTAPSTAGTFHVVASSAVDPSKKGTATIHVVPKQKDKEKEKEKELLKETRKEKDKDFADTKHGRVEVIMQPILVPGLEQIPSAFETPAVGRAFIRPAERPEPTPFADDGAP